ncbi:hypothetical protein HNR42_002480 [Deinobacterium chartae]|uniref:DUF1795 domain-containing protein n=1 Tax=Deinobacterium chartae TaxID=521158 RepID=A0A841I235_9DEIO|nr:hypothetical protein [Deinobacterium chartae]MBB6099044.1 hypothetical protein [Deinobacterium chartae]
MRYVLILSAALLSSALAQPIPGWSASAKIGSTQTFTAPGGACAIRDSLSLRSFRPFSNQNDAESFAKTLQTGLLAQGFRNVVTQAVSRPDQWGVLASYTYVQKGQPYSISQVYLSQAGRLRTLTGSTRQGERDGCAPKMQEFLKFAAY